MTIRYFVLSIVAKLFNVPILEEILWKRILVQFYDDVYSYDDFDAENSLRGVLTTLDFTLYQCFSDRLIIKHYEMYDC